MKTNDKPKEKKKRSKDRTIPYIREVRKMNSFPAIEIKEGEGEREH